MAEPHWTSYIGMITGIAGGAMGLISLIRIYRLKKLDLRLELRKAFNDLDLVLVGIDEYLEHVYESHRRVLSATGYNQSGQWVQFESDYAKDVETLRKMKAEQPQRSEHYDGHSPEQLETALVEVHQFKGELVKFRSKYAAIGDSDEVQRAELRARVGRV